MLTMSKHSAWLGLAAFLLGVFWGEKAILGFIAVMLWDAFVIWLMRSSKS